MDGPQGAKIQSVEEMAVRFYTELLNQMPAWKERLFAVPGDLEPLEREVHAAFSRGADLVMAGLIAVALHQPALAAASERTRSRYLQPLACGRQWMVRVRFGGLCMCPRCRECRRFPVDDRPKLQGSKANGSLPVLACRQRPVFVLAESLSQAVRLVQLDAVRHGQTD